MSSDRPPLTPSLQRMLTVTNPDGTPRTSQVTPSPLLSRLNTFIPRLAAANRNLSKTPPQIDPFTPTKLQSNSHHPRQSPSSQSEALPNPPAVTMSLYVDDSLGNLVPSSDPSDNSPNSNKYPKHSVPPLVEMIPQYSPPRE